MLIFRSRNLSVLLLSISAALTSVSVYAVKESPGTIYHNTSAHEYLLPFEHDKMVLIGQSYNDSFSHSSGDNQWAVDFRVWEGTKILAVRGGEVDDIQDGIVTNCLIDANNDDYPARHTTDCAWNFIKVKHFINDCDPSLPGCVADGTYSVYGHLKNRGVCASVGDIVNVGDVIGLSGNTGRSSGAHLHLGFLGYNASHPPRFKDVNHNNGAPEANYSCISFKGNCITASIFPSNFVSSANVEGIDHCSLNGIPVAPQIKVESDQMADWRYAPVQMRAILDNTQLMDDDYVLTSFFNDWPPSLEQYFEATHGGGGYLKASSWLFLKLPDYPNDSNSYYHIMNMYTLEFLDIDEFGNLFINLMTPEAVWMVEEPTPYWHQGFSIKTLNPAYFAGNTPYPFAYLSAANGNLSASPSRFTWQFHTPVDYLRGWKREILRTFLDTEEYDKDIWIYDE